MNHIIQDITDFIFVSDTPQKADIIFVMGGSYPEPAETAAALYHEGYAPLIHIGGGVSITTGKFPGPQSKRKLYTGNYETEFEFYTDVLVKNDVPAEVIIGEDQSSFTQETAMYARRVVDEKQIPVRKALIVCKAFHARRCLMAYQSAFPTVEFYVIPVPGYDITKDNWYQSETAITRVLGEMRRIGDQFTVADINQFKK